MEEQEKKTFSAIVGLEDLKEHLQNAISMDKISHAYIINGEKDSGKMMLAEAFAATLLCERKGKDACMECRSCRQAAGRNNPDIIYITHEKPNVISVDDIRRQLNDSVVIRPYAAARKVYIVDEAEKMNPQAQNALLKTIEEPPSYVVILLLTTNADGFLPTILSRCVTLNVKPVSAGKIEKMLMERCHVVDYHYTYIYFFPGECGEGDPSGLLRGVWTEEKCRCGVAGYPAADGAGGNPEYGQGSGQGEEGNRGISRSDYPLVSGCVII